MQNPVDEHNGAWFYYAKGGGIWFNLGRLRQTSPPPGVPTPTASLSSHPRCLTFLPIRPTPSDPAPSDPTPSDPTPSDAHSIHRAKPTPSTPIPYQDNPLFGPH